LLEKIIIFLYIEKIIIFLYIFNKDEAIIYFFNKNIIIFQ